MEIARKTDYALRMLATLATDPAGVVSVREAARANGVPYSFARSIQHDLALAGIVENSRGANGGMRLAVDPREVTLVVPKPITGAWGTGEGVAHKIDVPDVPNNIRSELEDFVRCIRGQEPLVLGVEEAERVTLQSLEVMDEIRSQLGVVFE